jgi:Mg-chelatase subunit ChlD
VASRRRSASPVRIRLARSFEERRSSTQASHPRGEFAPVQVASLPPDALRRRSPASTNDPDEEVIGLSAALSRERARSTSPHGPFGLATGSGDRHVVYVVDASSGMSTHWRRAISEVVESIRSLSSDDTFDIVTFNGRANAFSSTLMPAIPGTEASIIDYLKYVRVAGSANLQDALWVALRLPEVNEVVIVTSGAPTAGETDPRRLARFASSENPGGVRIDTVGVVDADGDRASAGTLLRRIARDSGGDTRLVSID